MLQLFIDQLSRKEKWQVAKSIDCNKPWNNGSPNLELTNQWLAWIQVNANRVTKQIYFNGFKYGSFSMIDNPLPSDNHGINLCQLAVNNYLSARILWS